MISLMRTNLKKLVDILIISLDSIRFSFFTQEGMGGTRHFRRLVSLSPAMQHVPPKPKYKLIDIKKGLYRTLYVDETIEESLSRRTNSPKSYIHVLNSSDTILNSTSSYLIKSNKPTYNLETL